MTFDTDRVREDFPILHQQVKGHPLAYLDNAASTQKPRQVIETIKAFYEHDFANVHRGVHTLSQRATDAFEGARRKVQGFINSPAPEEVIFVRGVTEAVNLVAGSWGRSTLKPGDEILVSAMEHHSNIVPWQRLCRETGAVLKVIPMNRRGELLLDEYAKLLNDRTRLVGCVHLSNSLGTLNDIRTMAAMAHEAGALFLADAAQSAAHYPIDVQAAGVDFLALSAHKTYGPTGIGALYGRRELLEAMEPWQSGGDMILSVTFEETLYNELPYKFEAGTPNITGAVAYGAAIDYMLKLGIETIHKREMELLRYAEETLRDIEGLRFIGEAENKSSLVSFTLEGIHPHDLGTLLDDRGIAVRTGHHCTQPVMEFFGIPATTRASMAFYNTEEEIDRLHAGLLEAVKLFR